MTVRSEHWKPYDRSILCVDRTLQPKKFSPKIIAAARTSHDSFSSLVRWFGGHSRFKAMVSGRFSDDGVVGVPGDESVEAEPGFPSA